MEKSLKLYEIASSLKKLEEITEDENELASYLDSVEMQLKEKAENVIKFRQGLIASSEAIDSEIKRLSDIKKSFLRKADNIKGYISHTMEINDIERIDTDFTKIYFLNSETLDVVDESKIPEKYIKQIITKNVDKMAIKKDIKSGMEIPGTVLTTHKNLQIK